MDRETGKLICVKLDPPLFAIGAKTEGSKHTYWIPIDEFYELVKGREDVLLHQPGAKPDNAPEPTIAEEVVNILQAKPGKRLHFARILQELKNKGMEHLDRKIAGQMLSMMTEMGTLKQEKMEYILQ
jgi:hypothetical protein